MSRKLSNEEVTVLATTKPFTNKEINQLIINFSPLAKHLAAHFPRKYIEQSEARGIALLTLVKCVNVIPKLPDKSNIGAWINYRIVAHLRQYSYRWKGIIKYHEDVQYHHFNDKNEPEIKHYFSLDLQDTIDKIVTERIDRVIITRVIEGGYKDREIAAECNITKQAITRRRNNLFEKLRRVLK